MPELGTDEQRVIVNALDVAAQTFGKQVAEWVERRDENMAERLRKQRDRAGALRDWLAFSWNVTAAPE